MGREAEQAVGIGRRSAASSLSWLTGTAAERESDTAETVELRSTGRPRATVPTQDYLSTNFANIFFGSIAMNSPSLLASTSPF